MPKPRDPKKYYHWVSTVPAAGVMLIGVILAFLWQRPGPFVASAMIVFLSFAISYLGVIFKSRLATNIVFCSLLALLTLGNVAQFSVQSTRKMQQKRALDTIRQEALESLDDAESQIAEHGYAEFSESDFARRSDLLRQAANKSSGHEQQSLRALADWLDRLAELQDAYMSLVAPEWDGLRYTSIDAMDNDIDSWVRNADGAETVRLHLAESTEYLTRRLIAHGMDVSVAPREAPKLNEQNLMSSRVELWQLEREISEGMVKDLSFLRDRFGLWTYDAEKDLIYFDRDEDSAQYGEIEDRLIELTEAQAELQQEILAQDRRRLESQPK